MLLSSLKRPRTERPTRLCTALLCVAAHVAVVSSLLSLNAPHPVAQAEILEPTPVVEERLKLPRAPVHIPPPRAQPHKPPEPILPDALPPPPPPPPPVVAMPISLPSLPNYTFPVRTPEPVELPSEPIVHQPAPEPAPTPQPVAPDATPQQSVTETTVQITPEQPGDQLLNEGDADAAPQELHSPAPTYPPHLQRRRSGGAVCVAIIVDQTGRIESWEVLSSPNSAFSRAVTRTLPRYRFKPGTKDGRSVRVRCMKTFRFQPGAS
ncbi:MAG TPA: hypothetical protein DCR55_05515 [Lentisphaeria bacterium]|nr:hypothetical protein [Lentisphaeria bacterium]